jgi:hypothetical protein
MNLSRACAIILGLSFFTIYAFADPTLEQLDPVSVTVALGNGGAASALLNGVSVEIFCVDFANNIYVPYNPPTYPGYTAYVSDITAGSNLSDTRFGGVTSWTTITLAGDTTDSNTINNANALARYQMAGYLVSLYNLQAGATTANKGIQTAIWDLLDPSGATAPSLSDPTSYLEQAASWYSGTSSTARDTFLTNFRVVSDPNMSGCGSGPKCGGFQEQLTILPNGNITEVPEPRGLILMLFGLLAVCSIAYRKAQVGRA